MSGHTYIHTHTHTHTHRKTAEDSVRTTMKALKCKPSAQFAYNYTINVLSKCSNIISHRSSSLRRSTQRPSILEGLHIDRRSSKVDTSIFEGRHINHRSSKVDTSIFEDRRRKHRTDNPTSHRHSDNLSPNIVHNGAS